MPNHFLLTGNELVADWPEPLMDIIAPDTYDQRSVAFVNRPRYTCSPELLAMLKEGERYELDKDFELDPKWIDNDWHINAVVIKTKLDYRSIEQQLRKH